MAGNKQIQIIAMPEDKLGVEHFNLVETAIEEPAENQVLCRTLYLSLDPANRAWMQGATYRSALETGQVMSGFTLAEVVRSEHPDFAEGDLVETDGGWQEYFVKDAAGLPVSYWETTPQQMMRPCRFMRKSTASRVCPPTLSKYRSTPSGQVALSTWKMFSFL